MFTVLYALVRAVLSHSNEDDRKIALDYFSHLMSADSNNPLAPSKDSVRKNPARRVESILILFLSLAPSRCGVNTPARSTNSTF